MHEPAVAMPTPDFRILFETLSGPCLVLDQNLTVVAVSDAYLRVAARQREELLGKSVVALVPEEAADELRSSLSRVLDSGMEDALPGRQAVNTPLRDRDGRIACIVHRLEDMTDRLRLQAAEEAVQRGSEESQRFAYLAAHDLQSPLNAISGCVRLLREECEGKLSEQGETLMSYVLDYTQRAQTLIQDLLAYSRLASRSRAFEATDLNAAFRDATEIAAKRLADRGAEIVCDPLPTLCVDRYQISQLFAHLLDNAVKFNRAERPRVRVTAERRGAEWQFSVEDNGIGIEPRFHAEIFEIFRRLHSAQAYPGSGIGLASCQRIATRHGGRIWVESAEGRGATFRFTLPA